MRKFILLALALTVSASAWASSIMDGQRVTTGTRPNHSGDIVGGWYPTDSTGRYLKFDVNGNLITTEAAPEWVQNGILSLGISTLSLASGATAGNTNAFFADLSPYSHATLLLTWDPADSSNIALGVTLFNKESAAWSTYDTPALLPFGIQHRAPADSALSVADTLYTLNWMFNGQMAKPTYYVARTRATPAAGTYTLTALSNTPRIIPGPAGVAINLDNVCGSWSYFGVLLTNCSGSPVDQIKAVLWVSR